MNLTGQQTALLLWLHERGGEGVLDRYGRVCSGGETRPVGAWIAWLNLVAKGLLAGSGGRVRLTDAGREAALR